jgi:uncharacterized protein YoaH (UPF0181 family)
MKAKGRLIPWTREKLLKAVEMVDYLMAKGLHLSQAEELAMKDMFSM